MTIHYITTHRQAGKTNLALYEAYKEKSHMYLHPSGYLYNRVHGLRSMSYNQFFTRASFGANFKILILDEYLFCPAKIKIKIFEFVFRNIHTIENVFIFSTPQVQYQQELLDLIIHLKEDGINRSDVRAKVIRDSLPILSIVEMDDNQLSSAINDLWFDLLTFPDLPGVTKLISNGNTLPFFNNRIKFSEYHSAPEISGEYIIL